MKFKELTLDAQESKERCLEQNASTKCDIIKLFSGQQFSLASFLEAFHHACLSSCGSGPQRIMKTVPQRCTLATENLVSFGVSLVQSMRLP